MNKTYAKMLEERITDLKAEIATTKTRSDISKNTRSTKLYGLSRERRTLNLISSLISQLPDTFKLKEDDMNTLVLLTTLSSERASSSSIVIKEGDNILNILIDHPNLNKRRLEEKCEKLGLVCNYTTGVIEAK